MVVDVEHHWRPMASVDLPDVVSYLRKQSSQGEGFLTWQTFSEAIKMAILRQEASKSRSVIEQNDDSHFDTPCERETSMTSSVLFSSSSPHPLHRAHSLPNLSLSPSTKSCCSSKSPPPAPPKPPRELIMAATKRHFEQFIRDSNKTKEEGLKSGNASSIVFKRGFENGRRSRTKGQNSDHNARRHSVHLGVDLSLMKYYHSLRESKWALEEGLLTLELVRQGFRRSMLSIDDQLKGGLNKNINKTPQSKQKDKLALELRVIRQLIQRLRNLTLSTTNSTLSDPNKFMPEDLLTDHQLVEHQLTNLKRQNKMLTDELAAKSVIIAKLEDEKTALIRQVFNANSSNAAVKTDQ